MVTRIPLRDFEPRWLQWAVLLAVIAMAAASTKADAPAESGSAMTAAAKTRRDAAIDPVADKSREFLAAVAMWCGIVILGLALIAMVMIWGRRLRHASRLSSRRRTELDPLWYLKPKKTPGPPADHQAAGGFDGPGSSVSPP